MFLLNSRTGLFSVGEDSLKTISPPLLPKLRGHFAELLEDGYFLLLGAFTPIHLSRIKVR